MILLDPSLYKKVIKPLQGVTINNLFARSVVEAHVTGLVYVDNIKQPATFYVVHPYGMTLLFGKSDHKEFNAKLLDHALNTYRVRNYNEWMQTFPDSWDDTLARLFKDHLVRYDDKASSDKNSSIELHTRVNFKFHAGKFQQFKQSVNGGDFKIVRTDTDAYENMNGSVVPRHFWNNAVEFNKMGIGYSLYSSDRLASTAFSSYLHGNQLEIGIETMPEYQGRGYAQHTCAALIDYCLDNHYEPVWSCRLENTPSYLLAQKLGFEQTITIPYYRLCR